MVDFHTLHIRINFTQDPITKVRSSLLLAKINAKSDDLRLISCRSSKFSGSDIYLKFVVQLNTLSNDGKSKKAQEDVKDTVAEKTNDVKDTVAEDPGEENYFTNQAKKLREKGGEIVEDNKSPEEPSRIKLESDTFTQHRVSRATTKKGKDVFNTMARKPIVPILIIGAIVLVGIVLYALVQYGNQSYKVETFNASWNQSLGGLRNGNVSVTEYCNHDPHDQKLCDIFWKLKFM